jgi:hypothetical protein
MVAGMLAGAGYYMGAAPLAYGTRPANPKGFFEDPEINSINEELLAPLVPRRPRGPARRLFRKRPGEGARWLARVPVATELVPPAPALRSRIDEQVSHEPYCFKDPRFSYTLPYWRPLLRDPVFVCVFREPNRTAHSILTECRTEGYLRHVAYGYRDALETWTLMYRHVLERHLASGGEWLFLHSEQVLSGEATPFLERALEAAVDRGFPHSALMRSPAAGNVPPETGRLYRRLCDLAGYDG